jgi:hypothetical protein
MVCLQLYIIVNSYNMRKNKELFKECLLGQEFNVIYIYIYF